MRDQEGSELVTVPAYTYRSCSRCKHYDYHMVRSGQQPLYASNCNHPDVFGEHYSSKGNLNKDRTPEWCPYLKSAAPVVEEPATKKQLVIIQLDPAGVVINKTKIEVDPSSKEEWKPKKSRLFITNNKDVMLGKMNVYGENEIESVEFIPEIKD